MWAIPGGFKRPTETLDEAALARAGREETGVQRGEPPRPQFGAYGDPGRDPRMHVVTVAYLAVLRDLGIDRPPARMLLPLHSMPVSAVLNG